MKQSRRYCVLKLLSLLAIAMSVVVAESGVTEAQKMAGSGIELYTPYYKICARHSGKCAEVENGGMEDEANIHQWELYDPPYGIARQRWIITAVDGSQDLGFGRDDFYYKIKNSNSNKYMDVSEESLENGATVHQYRWLNGDNQQWTIIPVGEGFYRICAKHSGKCLDVDLWPGDPHGNGQNIQQWEWVGSNNDNQRWELRKCPVDADAQFWDYSGVPLKMAPATTAQVSITIKNNSGSTWTHAQAYKLGDPLDDNAVWGLHRVELDPGESVPPEAFKTFTFEITAPGDEGQYDFQWRMLQENVQWFGDYSPKVKIDVSAGYDWPQYIYGIHDQCQSPWDDPCAEETMAQAGKSGWIVFSVGLKDYTGTPNDYSWWMNQGLGVIVRLNWGYGWDGENPGDGTIPAEGTPEHAQFVQRCGTYVAQTPLSQAEKIVWVIANEPNLPVEWPGNEGWPFQPGNPVGNPITPQDYADTYKQCFDEITGAVPSAIVAPAPTAPQAPSYDGPPGPVEDFGIPGYIEYWRKVLQLIGAKPGGNDNIGGLIVHTYTHCDAQCDPELVDSTHVMGGEYEGMGYYFHFWSYKNYLDVANQEGLHEKPVWITESNQNRQPGEYDWDPDYGRTSNWILNAYTEIDEWNTVPGYGTGQKILGLCLYRWWDLWEGDRNWSILAVDAAREGFRDVMLNTDFQWPPARGCSPLPPNPVPFLIAPEENGVVTSGPELVWSGCPEAQRFQVELVGRIRWRSGPLVSTSLDISGFSFSPGKDYRWKARCCYDVSCELHGPWSALNTFWWQLDRPVATDPVNGAVVDSGPRFDWGDFEEAGRYQVRLGGWKSLPLKGTSFNAGDGLNLQIGRQYSWSARACFDWNQSDCTSSTPWSDAASFWWREYDRPVLVSPGDGAQLYYGPIFFWEHYASATGYKVTIDGPGVGWTSPILADSSCDATGVALFHEDEEYAWRVKACLTEDCTGFTPWSTTHTFMWKVIDIE